MAKSKDGKRTRILLSGVFGPFGVDDEFGRKENIMELFHNQVTKGQGIASFRYHHRSFGLYFIAANIDADVTILDFPSRKRFEREVRKGYDVVGISFITPNVSKAEEMARVTRKSSPSSVIVIGGHGAAIDGIEDRIECDHVVKGEGIRWMRAYLGQDPDAPIVHPTLPATERMSIFGVPVPQKPSGMLVPGVGCVNACKFCCTSHFFGKRYTSYLSTGREVFETCCRISDELGSDEFFVMDENFLKNRDRALELVDEMERHGRFFTFQIFSSAEAIMAFGLDNMERLGVQFVWIGVESSSSKGNFDKNRGIDPAALVSDLHDRGIIVLASGILCQEHHTPENIQHEIDFMVKLRADFVQFMLLTPLPVTGLYESHRKRGLLRDDLPFEEWHGQKHLSYRHPLFPGDAPERWIEAAFRADYHENSSSMLRVIATSLRGWKALDARRDLDPCLTARKAMLEKQIRLWSCMLPVIDRHPVNLREQLRARDLDAQIREVLPLGTSQHIERFFTPLAASHWKRRVARKGDMIQPRTIVTRYRATGRHHIPDNVVPIPDATTALDVAAASLAD